MTTRTTDPTVIWRAVEQAGGMETYIEQQLSAHGFLVERKPTDNMSKRELAQYKKQLKEEAKEKVRLKKEAWQAFKSSHILHLGEGIHWNDESDFDKWDLDEPEARAALNEMPAIDTPKQLAEALGLTVNELRWMTYHRDAATGLHYRRFTIPKGDGSKRAIWAPLPKLKKAQRWILREIVEHLPVHGAVHGFLPGRSILSNAAVHTDSKIVVNMDLKDFFPTVSYRRVKGLFRKAGYRDQIATLLALLCTESPRKEVMHDSKKYFIALGPRCLPQGAPTSPGLTNTIGMRLDRRLSGLATKLGWRYTRYADDLTFSLPSSHKGQPHLGILMGFVKKIVADEGFQVHPEKTRIKRKGGAQKVTGLVVNGADGPRVPRKLKRQLRAAIHNLKNGKPLPDGESIAGLAGYAAFIYMTEPKLGGDLLKALGEISKQ